VQRLSPGSQAPCRAWAGVTLAAKLNNESSNATAMNFLISIHLLSFYFLA